MVPDMEAMLMMLPWMLLSTMIFATARAMMYSPVRFTSITSLQSSTVASKSLQKGWRELAIPLLTWENDYLDDLAMTGKRSDIDFGEVEKDRYLWMVNAPHPLSAGLAAGTLNVYQAQAPMSWGKPGLGATIIATVYGQPEKPAIWAYEKGATMDYETLAPAKRMMFFMNNDTFTNLNSDGLKLFDQAIEWMLLK